MTLSRSLLLVTAAVSALGQIPDNRSLNGRYHLRHVQLTVAASGAITAAKSFSGSATFNGSGGFTFQGQQAIGTAVPITVSGTGTYAVQSSGIMTLTNPQESTLVMNGRLGAGLLLASTTEGTAGYDLLIGVPVSAATPALTGTYHVSSLDFVGASAGMVHGAFFKATAAGGSFGNPAITGQGANLGAQNVSQTITGASYTLTTDGSGTASFPIPGSSTAATQLVGGSKTLYASSDGALFIAGGSGHDLMVGVRALAAGANSASWQGLYFTAGLRLDREFNSHAGSASSSGAGKLVASRRVRTPATTLDFTGATNYTVNTDSTALSPEMNSIGLGAGGQAFVVSGTAAQTSGVYEIQIGIRAPSISQSGVFLHPQGIVNAASFAPVGAPLAAGEFVTLFGSGLSGRTEVASTLPFRNSLAGVEVLINDVRAPVYSVSSSQISALVPYGISGSAATVVVTNNGTRSNPVTAPVRRTSPGIFSLTQNGLGSGAVLHADFSLVNAANPARVNETVLIFLTGLGAVSPPVADGSAGPANPLSTADTPVTVYIGGVQAAVSYKGLAPGFAGLYQLNVVVPRATPLGVTSLAVDTGDAFHDQVDITIAP